MSPYYFRLFVHADLRMVARWLRTPEVVRWWGDPEEQEALVTQDLDEPLMRQWIVEHERFPFAYAQAYPAHAWPQPHLAHLPAGTANHRWTNTNRGSWCERCRGNDPLGAEGQARAANCNVAAQTGIVSAGEFGAGPRKVIKTSQIHGSCMHFRVRVLPAQPRSLSPWLWIEYKMRLPVALPNDHSVD
jgi:hypothetical protein